MQDDNLLSNGLSIEQYAQSVFGDAALADQWMSKHHLLLDASPRSVISTHEGEQEVIRILASIEHGLPV